MMKKKGYVFLIDAIFAIVILIIGFLMISSNYSSENTEVPLSIVSDNTVNFLSNIKVDELCDIDDCRCSNQELEDLCSSGDIKNANQSLFDYFGELYYREEEGDIASGTAENLFQDITTKNNLLREDVFGVRFVITKDSNEAEIYSNSAQPEKSKDLISSKKVIFGYYEDISLGQVTFWGPYVARIDVWQR